MMMNQNKRSQWSKFIGWAEYCGAQSLLGLTRTKGHLFVIAIWGHASPPLLHEAVCSFLWWLKMEVFRNEMFVELFCLVFKRRPLWWSTNEWYLNYLHPIEKTFRKKGPQNVYKNKTVSATVPWMMMIRLIFLPYFSSSKKCSYCWWDPIKNNCTLSFSFLRHNLGCSDSPVPSLKFRIRIGQEFLFFRCETLKMLPTH